MAAGGWLLQDKYEQATYLRNYKGPLLIVRAGRDDVVPPARTDQLIASIGRKQVLDLPNDDHATVASAATYAQTLAAFVGTP